MVAYAAIGDRSERTCRSLWRRIPQSYRKGAFYTDFWESYQKVLPEGQHQPVGKGVADEPATWRDGTVRYVSAWGVS